MNADTDYARIVQMLTKQQLAAYVAYDSHDDLNGMGKSQSSEHIVVRVSDGKIVSGKPDITIQSGSDRQEFNPITRPAFDPACYRATSETPATYDGRDAVQFTLTATCKEHGKDSHDYLFTTLFADARTMRPLYAVGNVPESDDSKGVAVSVEEQFGEFSGRVMPTLIKVDVAGSGFMFWLQVHVSETYANYTFSSSP